MLFAFFLAYVHFVLFIFWEYYAFMWYLLIVSSTPIRYTSSSGERRIRVHTAAAPVVTDLSEMYRQADTGAIVSLLGRIG